MGRYEHDWPVGAPKYAVWGVGPLSQGSTAAEPVVLFHAPSNKARPRLFVLGICNMGEGFQGSRFEFGRHLCLEFFCIDRCDLEQKYTPDAEANSRLAW